MKRYLRKATLFILPIVLISVGLEIFLKTAPSAYLLKSNYFKNSKYQILILGSSHNQNAINPAFIDVKSCNASMGSQDLKLDLALFKKSLEINDSLNVLILEFSYHRFRNNPDLYWRNSLNEYFYEIDLTGKLNPLKYFLIGSNLKFFRNYFGDLVSRHGHDYNYNMYGFDENDFDGTFKELKYDSVKINSLSITKINDGRDSIGFQKSLSYLEEINNLCIANKIKLILVAPPVYRTYSNSFSITQLKAREEVVRILKEKNNNITWLNFEKSPLFRLNHFKNDNHLNATGAKLFTQLLSDTLKLNTRNLLLSERSR